MDDPRHQKLNPLEEIEKQIERASHFIHSSMEMHVERINQIETQLYGLIDLLLEKGEMDQTALLEVSEKIKNVREQNNQNLYSRFAVRHDPPESDEVDFVPVNCDERVHVCKSICCKMNFALSSEEIHSGKIKWDLGQPYLLRHAADGYCSHMDRQEFCCSIYEDRPKICRNYSCASDKRIWKDFEKMELNHEWIEKNIPKDSLSITNISMNPEFKFSVD